MLLYIVIVINIVIYYYNIRDFLYPYIKYNIALYSTIVHIAIF